MLVAAKAITDATPFSQLAAVYQRAARHALSTDLSAHLQVSANTARQLAHAITQASQTEQVTRP